MSLRHLEFLSIDEAALVRLIDERISESKILEYKAALVLSTDGQKQEFLSDITAFANTDGGDVVFGMREENGQAKELVGLRNLIPDDVISRIENLLRDAVQPRISGMQIRAIPLRNGCHTLLIRVSRSFAAPHMVRHQGVTRFCGRNSNGKYDLDLPELRSAFLASESLTDRLKSFRLDRINKLISGGSTLPLSSKRLTVMHVLPVISARPDVRLSAGALQKIKAYSQLRPIYSSGYGHYSNFDGLAIAANGGDGKFSSLVQIFRNGFLEAVECQLIELNSRFDSGDTKSTLIPSVIWEQSLLEVMPTYLSALSQLGFPPPYVVSISLLNVRGYRMASGANYFSYAARSIDRDNLLTDDVLVEEPIPSADSILRPLFDQVWNACGWSGSLHFDEQGNWRGQ